MISTKIKLIFFLIAAYVVLFEFIFPANGVFPSVSVIILSLTELIDNYSLLINLTSTFAAVYITIFANYLIVKILFPFLISSNFDFDQQKSKSAETILSIFTYVPFILIAVLILVWLPEFVLDKYIIVLAVFLPGSLQALLQTDYSDKTNYYYFYKSLGIKKSFILNKIIFKLVEPEYFLYQIKNHSLIWCVVLVTEFIQKREGVGSILFNLYKYQDVASLFTVVIIVALIVFTIQIVMNILLNKAYFWK